MRVHAHELREGDILVGVLSGRPWRQVRSISKFDNDFDAAPDTGHGFTIDAVPVDHVGDFYSPIDLAASATIEIERIES